MSCIWSLNINAPLHCKRSKNFSLSCIEQEVAQLRANMKLKSFT